MKRERCDTIQEFDDCIRRAMADVSLLDASAAEWHDVIVTLGKATAYATARARTASLPLAEQLRQTAGIMEER